MAERAKIRRFGAVDRCSNVELFNHSVDENLGYDPRHRPFVREWVEFGSGSSPDLLDACYYALQDVDVGSGYESSGLGFWSGDMYGRGRR
jgi:hypothetical protein